MRTLADSSSPSANCSTLFETTFDCVAGMTNIPFNGRCVSSHALSGILLRTSAKCWRNVATSSAVSPLGSPALSLSTTTGAEVAQAHQKIGLEVATSGVHRQRIEKAQPAFAGAAAILMIAATMSHGAAERSGAAGLEEIGVPHVPAVTPWAAGAASIAFPGRGLAVPVATLITRSGRAAAAAAATFGNGQAFGSLQACVG